MDRDERNARIEDAVSKSISAANRYPFLFVGSGLSRRYLGTSDWVSLLHGVCSQTIGEEEFLVLRSRASTSFRRGEIPSELPYLAEVMEDGVNDSVLRLPEFSELRSRYSKEIESGVSAMKILVSDTLRGMSATPCPEIAELAAAGHDKVSGVITTNYDKLCEELFPGFDRYIGEEGLIFRDPTFAQEIYEIHGSIDDPASIVLTSADYRSFEDKEQYLAAKILTVFMEYPVIFLGYSIADENVKSILGEVARCVGPEHLDELKDRIVFVDYGNGGDHPVSTHSMEFHGRTLTMTRITTNDFMPIYKAVAKSSKLYDARFIREMRGSIYRLAAAVDPKSEVVTAGVDAVLDHFEPGQKVIIGLGLPDRIWGVPITVDEVYEDVVMDDQLISPELFVDFYLDKTLKASVVPFQKYVSAYAGKLYGTVLKKFNEQTSVDAFRNPTTRALLEGQRRRFSGSLSVGGLISRLGPENAYKHLFVLEDDEIDAHELGEYLKSFLKPIEGDKDAVRDFLKSPEYRRAVRIYDFIRYRYGKSPDIHQ